MEFLYVIFSIVIIILLINNKSNLNNRIDLLERHITDLQRLIKNLSESKPTVENPKPETDYRAKPIEEVKKPETVKPLQVPPPPEIIERQPEVISDSRPVINRPIKTTDIPEVFKKYTPPAPQPSFFERHPDLEKFIGENLVNKIGIAILVLAIGFFVKYAIDNDWIGPVGRVGIGILCGGILIGIAHRLRNSYAAFSSVLVGGGLAVLYFTITLAYHQFHLFNQTASFIILIVITCFSVALSLLYNRQELAIIALVGGLASPFMVSSGNANYHGLFIYLVILNAGLLIIAYNKLWRILNITAFVLTVIVFSATMYTLTAPTYAIGFIYATILYLLFFGINIANNVKENKKFVSADFSILLANTALYFGAGLYLLTEMHRQQFHGLFSASLGLLNLVLSYLLFRNRKVDTNILYLLIGITLTFVSLTAPIQLHGHNITLFWAAETVLLYWLYQKSGIKLMKLTSLLVWGAMLLSLLMDWVSVYSSPSLKLMIVANKGFITTLAAAVSSYVLFMLISMGGEEERMEMKRRSLLFSYSAIILLFMSGLLEINHQFLNRYPGTGLNTIYLMLYMPAFVYLFYIATKKAADMRLPWQVGVIVVALSMLVYLVCSPQFFDVQYAMLVQHKAVTVHFAAHWLGTIFTGLLFYQLCMLIKNNAPKPMQTASGWVLTVAVVLFLSLEVCLLNNFLFYSPAYPIARIQTVYIKTTLPVLWGLISFALMWLGMKHKARNLRIISLTLLTINLAKLFIFDIRNIPPAGKIAAFFCLGILLLVISFMYQKVKKIIVDDEQPKND